MAAITENGFVRPTYAELLEAAVARAKVAFGDDVDTGEQTALGKFLRIGVYDLAALYEELEGVYFARFPHYASGVNLDRLTPFAGVSRNPAVAAVYSVRISGTAGAEMGAGFLLGTAGGVFFRAESPFAIGAGGTAEVKFTCTARGTAGNVPPSAITIIVNPDARVDAILPLAQLVEGRARESDVELRARFDAGVAGIGSATLDAVKAAVLRVTGVLGCVILENDSAETDANGLPPHSFETFVLTETAGDNDIAAAIFSKKPLGIRSHGDISVDVPDSGGSPHTVCFSRVAEIALRLRLTVLHDSLFPSDGEARVRDALAAYVNAFTNGQDLAFASLYSVLYRIPGVRDVRDMEASKDGGASWSAANVIAGPAQAVRLARADIHLEVEAYADQ